MAKIQQIVFPSFDIQAPLDMYFRGDRSKIDYSLSNETILIKREGRISFDTFFNGISPSVWKAYCKIDDLCFKVFGNGRIKIRFGQHRVGMPTLWLTECELDLDENGTDIDMPFWKTVNDGMLFFSIYAQTDVFLKKAYFYTTTSPLQDVKLGIVVTHFNRKQYVIPAINRIDKKILSDDDFRGKISLIVVDNSQNITADEAKSATLIPNKNYGGSGGFTRGLLYLKDNGFTHCLFMDDDGSCEIESIRRTYAFYSFCNPDSNLAMAGTLLLEKAPSIIHEKGACFDKRSLYCINQGLDTRVIEQLLESDREDKRANYGAWCFFSFAISQIKRFSFPFFVRGDDILFSIINSLKIVTMNGIAVWIEDFSDKESPLTRYLGTRGLSVGRILAFDLDKKTLLKDFSRDFFSSLYSYNYCSAVARCLSINDILAGPNSFINDMDASVVRKKINEFANGEKLMPCEHENFVVKQNCREKKLHKILRKLTLNGFLLPQFCLKKKTVYQPKGFSANLCQVFRHKKIYYHNRITNTGYYAVHDKHEFFRCIKMYIQTRNNLIKNFDDAKSKYLNQKDWLTSEEFWRDAFNIKKD